MGGLPEKYREKGKLRYHTCEFCKREFVTTMKLPQCGICRKYATKQNFFRNYQLRKEGNTV